MAPDFTTYLATQIIAEKNTVSYRNVARTLKVHVNSAKCMLYEFREKENKKKPDSIYATYLIAGSKKITPKAALTNGHSKHADEDEPMPSSPPFPSSMLDPSQQTQHAEEDEHVSVKTISLVREEDVEKVKEQYNEITSIHLYSLSPGRLQDLVVLTDISRGLYANTSAKEDPLTNNKMYGIIQNPGVRRRKGKRPVIPEASESKFKPTKDEKNKKQEASKTAQDATNTKTEAKDSSRPGSRESSVSAPSGKQASLKRDGSNLFKAFAKAQNKPKVDRKDTNASTDAAGSGIEDTKMTDADEEGESEDDALFLDTGTRKTGSRKRTSDVMKEREDKKAKLRKMMDSDDEDDKAVPNVEKAAGVDEPPPAAQGEAQVGKADDDKEDVAWSDSDTEEQRQKAPAKDASTTKDGEQISTEPKRRRGKRKVMKKRTMKDEEGFLVTKEEAVWESFSEDEPAPSKEKSKSAFSSMKSQPASQKSSAGAKGGTQKKKDIMSFFGKK